MPQREQLHAEARDAGLSLQQLLELKLFGEIRPRVRKRRRPTVDGQQLDLAGLGHEEGRLAIPA